MLLLYQNELYTFVLYLPTFKQTDVNIKRNISGSSCLMSMFKFMICVFSQLFSRIYFIL